MGPNSIKHLNFTDFPLQNDGSLNHFFLHVLLWYLSFRTNVYLPIQWTNKALEINCPWLFIHSILIQQNSLTLVHNTVYYAVCSYGNSSVRGQNKQSNTRSYFLPKVTPGSWAFKLDQELLSVTQELLCISTFWKSKWMVQSPEIFNYGRRYFGTKTSAWTYCR